MQKYNNLVREVVNGKFLIERSSKIFKMPSMHSHDSYELYYMVNGERDYFVETNFFTVKTGEFALVPQGMLHKTGGKGGARILISFTTDFLHTYFTPLATEKLLTAFNRFHIHPESSVQERINEIINTLFEFYNKNCLDELFPYVDELLNILIKSPSAVETTSLPSSHINNIIEYISKHFNEIEGIEEVAEKFYISKFYLCRTFKKLMGIPFITYLTQIKLKHSVKLLTTTKMDISNVALESGFNSPAYFCNIFKNNFKISPLAYRKKYSNN